ncbi:unnamed protein product [Nyctereutes procyonoides]|uniref:(raccoon dog) hypothetical protein n=1 Tax=Nyctereutes procyonoides TaxID=34880 RepID=A0A811YAL4_NYCPR|nr:unnamed protein product [Nyctereutes procyonoides]
MELGHLKEMGPASARGVLVEHTVKDVLPALENNTGLNEFQGEYNIRLMGEDEKPATKENSEGAGSKSSSAGVLVS